MKEKLTKQECLDLLDRYENWNHGQKSVGHAFGGDPTEEDKIYDQRRQLIKKVNERLLELI